MFVKYTTAPRKKPEEAADFAAITPGSFTDFSDAVSDVPIIAKYIVEEEVF